MQVLELFKGKSKIVYVSILLLSVISTLTNIGVLILINKALKYHSDSGGIDFNSSLIFLSLIVVSFVATATFNRYMVKVSNEIVYGIELSIINKVRTATFESYQSLGHEKIYAAIGDARIISRIPGAFIGLLKSALTIFCGFCFLFYSSLFSGLLLFLLMLVLLTNYLYRDRLISEDLNIIRDLQDKYYEHLHQLFGGFRQIKISPSRNSNLYYKHILINRRKSRELNVKTTNQHGVNELMGVYSWYIILGIIIFVLPSLLKINLVQMTAFITTVLFMMGPLSQVINFFPVYRGFKIAYERIGRIERNLIADQAFLQEQPAVRDFTTIRFEDVVYHNKDKMGHSFELKIPELIILKNEIIFIAGGNGSGKTTFVNLLTGLYEPTSGKVYIDDCEMSWKDFRIFCTNMSVIFTNHHLFSTNYDEHNLEESNGTLNRHIQRFNLDSIPKMDPLKKYFGYGLSKGQEKRAALVLSLLENKPLLILDEWAAEQDPFNKSVFYKEWIQYIRETGKTIIAVTHDDEYFAFADRVIKLKSGCIISDEYKLVK